MGTISAVSSKTVDPDPSIASAVGAHHEMRTALADIVDNAIDARAERITIRLVTRGARLEEILILDDGRGMDEQGLDDAMTFARRRDYEDDALGHFGLGLKAASLSQANVLDVYSKTIGAPAAGRRITKDRPTLVQTLDSAQVDEAFERPPIVGGSSAPRASMSGTVVRWTGIRGAIEGLDEEERRAWLSNAVEEIRSYLGLVFHRILGAEGPAIRIDEYDLDLEEVGVPRRVEAIDPFLPEAPRVRRRRLEGSLDGAAFSLDAVIIPEGARDRTGFIAAAKHSIAQKGQGLYVYRNDRLLQIGGWCSIVADRRDWEGVRIALDLDERLLEAVTINPEKSGVVLVDEMARAIRRAAGDCAFDELLAEAAKDAQEARQRTPRPIVFVEPRAGLGRTLYEAIEEAGSFSDEDGVIRIGWDRLDEGRLARVDFDGRRLWLNQRYRDVFSEGGGPDDAPLLKTLLYLIYGRFFEGSFMGAREKREAAAFDEIISAALREELGRRGTEGIE